MPERFWGTFSADTEEDLATGRTITRRSPGGPAVPKANLNRKGMAWRWGDFSVGLYVPLLEFNLVARMRGNARGAKGAGHSRPDRVGQLATGGTERLWRRAAALAEWHEPCKSRDLRTVL